MGYWSDPAVFHVIAHRGASAYAPDNSLRAFEIARKHHATDVEVDIHCTIDGEFVVRHDAVFTDNGSKYVSELSFDEYRRICDENSEVGVRLSDVVEVAEQQDLGIYLDVKQILPEHLHKLIETIRELDYASKIVVASFRTDIAKEVKESAPDFYTSVLFHDPNMDLNSLVKGVQCDFLHPCFDVFQDPLRHFTDSWIHNLRCTGAGLIAWNITDRKMADSIVMMDVQGACADDPQILQDALNKLDHI